MDLYERQESRAMCDNEYGDYFKCINGVRQDGVVSQLMFTVYMDELIKELQSAGKDNIEEYEHVTEMIRELSCGVNGFNMTEITDILAYISTK